MSVDSPQPKPAIRRGAGVAARFEVAGAVVLIAVIQTALPDSVTIGPAWFAWPTVELLVALWTLWVLARLDRWSAPHVHYLFGVYFALLLFASATNAILLLTTLVGGSEDSGVRLLFSGFGVLAINALSFGLIYWWLDSGGPVSRLSGQPEREVDLQFPQQQSDSTVVGWLPTLPDYMYVSYTNLVAFSPTDTMPMTHRAKALFAFQSVIALVTIMVTLSHAINVLN